MQIDKDAIVKSLRQLKTDSAPVGPKGLPRSRSNEDNYNGTYEMENLTDPGIIGGVTGTGEGPVIGRGRSNVG